MWRHGDVLIGTIAAIPAGARRRDTTVLMRGEVTGHAHRIETAQSAEVWEYAGELFVKVVDDVARMVHEEHKPIILPRGTYRVWQQREYTPAAIRRVVD